MAGSPAVPTSIHYSRLLVLVCLSPVGVRGDSDVFSSVPCAQKPMGSCHLAFSRLPLVFETFQVPMTFFCPQPLSDSCA